MANEPGRAAMTSRGPLRSWLFTPASRPERFAKARTACADVLIIDLEDAVAPRDKAPGRRAVMSHLGCRDGDLPLAVRVNALDTLDGLADILALSQAVALPDYVVLPKTESAAHLRILGQLFVGRPVNLVALVETARGLAGIGEIAEATPRLSGVMLGAADLAADLGCALAWEPLSFARSEVVAACARTGMLAIDSPFFNLENTDGCGAEASRAAAYGFGAKAAIHPSQICPINAAFTPSDEERAQAEAILTASEVGVGTIDGCMIDEATAKKARRVLSNLIRRA